MEHVLFSAPAEALAVLDALIAGRVEGSVYRGECACLVGTIANARHVEPNAVVGLPQDSSRPAEVWFMNIHKGDTPESSSICAVTAGWVRNWIATYGPK